MILEERPVRARRGDDDRGLRGRCLARLPLPARRVPARRRARIEGAIAQARGAGLLGDDVAGSGWSFDIELRRRRRRVHLRRGDGAVRVDRGRRGRSPATSRRSRSRSACSASRRRSTTSRPSSNVPLILRWGAAAYADDRHRGVDRPQAVLRLRRTSRSPGVYEVAFGATLRELLALAGGVPGGRRDPGGAPGRRGRRVRRAGPAGHAAHVRGRRARPARRSGSGVVMVFDETADLADALRRIAAFFRDESCGQCVPCRVGTVRQEELLARLAAGRPLDAVDGELARFADLAQAMRDASICGLGQTASSAIESALRAGLVHFDGCRGRRVTPRPHLHRRRRRARRSVPEPPPPAGGRRGRAHHRRRHRLRARGLDDPRGRARPVGIDTPTLCYVENLTPVNVCRVCVVEVTGSRVLVPACSRRVEPGMEVQTDSRARPAVAQGRAGAARVVGRPVARRSRRSPTATSRATPSATTPTPRGSGRRHRRPRAGERDAREPGHHHAADGAARRRDRRPAGQGRQRPLRPGLLALHPLLQVRRGVRRGRPEHVRDRRSPAAASTPGSRPSSTSRLPESACVYCGNCIGVCPTGALMFRSEYDLREAGDLDDPRSRPDRHDLPVLRRRLHAVARTSRTTGS